MENIIEAESLTKVYRHVKRKEGLKGALLAFFHREYKEVAAVDDISFRIAPGELVGYIGPNGAGKSTTIKMLTGILIPSSGKLLVNGLVPYQKRYEYTRHIGVVFGQRTQLWWDIPVIESFKLLGKVYGISPSDFNQRLSMFVELLNIGELFQVPVRKLSLGQRMRCDLVASMLHNPTILFLDEPTIGMDVVGKLRIREFLANINKELGVTMILTTHDLKEIEELCGRLLIIDHGNKIYDGNIAGFKKRYKLNRCITLQLYKPIDAVTLLRIFPEQENGFQWEIVHSLSIKATLKQENHIEVIEQALKHLPIHDITIEEPSIESVIRRIYSREEEL